jgi:predicted lactoylglutathione lyase
MAIDLGDFTYCLNVQDIQLSVRFYEQLGFQRVEEHLDEGWAVLKQNNCVLSLYEGHIERNLLNFRGADIPQLETTLMEHGLTLSKPAQKEPDGSWSAELKDPDGNVIYLNTFEEEREAYLARGKLFE